MAECRGIHCGVEWEKHGRRSSAKRDLFLQNGDWWSSADDQDDSRAIESVASNIHEPTGTLLWAFLFQSPEVPLVTRIKIPLFARSEVKTAKLRPSH